MDYLTVVEKWKNSKALSKDEKEELANLNEKDLYDSFYTNLAFGTGGMRGVMGIGTNKMNRFIIRKATLGFGRYLLKYELDACNKGVVIAHDNRFNGVEFMQEAANVLTSLGIKVYIFDSLRTTPELSFAVRYLNASGGINITASHNPKEYNGYKIYNSEGNQLILAQSNKVMDEISKIDDELDITIIPNNNLLVTLDNKVDEAFYQMVMDTSLNKKMAKDNITIVYTPQHGTGYVPVTTVLKRLGYKVIEVKEQCEPLPDFKNTKSPNPEMQVAYDLAIEYAKKYQADVVLSNDPDCDRIGVVVFDSNYNPTYLTGNQTAAILMEYLFSNKKEMGSLPNDGVIYNTIVSSPLGGLVAASYGVSVEQTLTGFKYIGDKIAKAIENNGKKFLIGYEESYGYLLNKEVRDKDGVQAAMIISEMVSFYKHQGKTLLDVYEAIQKKFGYFVESQKSFYATGSEGAAKISAIMDKLRNGNLEEICGEKVAIREDYLKLIKVTNGISSPLDYEQSNVLRYVFADGSFVAVRPSGTEPKIKYYFAISATTKEAAKARHDKIVSYFLDK